MTQEKDLEAIKRAESRFPLLEPIARRWSPRAFRDDPVEPEKLGSLLEAARWAPSSFNEQPWRFLVAVRRDDPEAFEKLSSCLLEGNRSWAGRAPVLLLTVAKTYFGDDPTRKNRHAWHDVGLATAQMVLQAAALGLSTHLMAGFDRDRARELLAIPDGYEPVAVMAVGYRGDPETLPPDLRERETAPRARKPLEEIAFGGRFGAPLSLRPSVEVEEEG